MKKRINKGVVVVLLTALLISQLTATIVLPLPALAWGEFTYKDEKELGKKFSVLIKSRMPLIDDPEVTRYVESIVARLSKSLPPQPFPFTVSVIRDTSINAFATPGAYLFINTGLILAMEHEAELAAVLSHEMAHVTQRHIARRIEKSQIVSLLSVIGALAGAFLGGEAGAAALAGSLAAGQATMLKYSREDEGEADQVGMNYLQKAKFSPTAFISAFQKMSKKQWSLGVAIPPYLSSHPGLQERIKSLSARIGFAPEKITKSPADDKVFFRIQTLIRARYSDADGAIVFFTKQMKGANKPMALMGLGIVMAEKNNITRATKYFSDAIACSPEDQLILREAGRFHFLKGDRRKGMNLLSKAISLDRKDIMALYFYARGLSDEGKNTQALSYMNEVLRAVPEDSEIHYLMGQYYGRLGDMFNANLRMSYSYLYQNVQSKTEQFLQKAKKLAKTEKDRKALVTFEKKYKERKEFWK